MDASSMHVDRLWLSFVLPLRTSKEVQNFEHHSPLQEFVVLDLRRLHSCIGGDASPKSISPCYISSSIVSRAGHFSCVSPGHRVTMPGPVRPLPFPGAEPLQAFRNTLYTVAAVTVRSRAIRYVGSTLPRR
jgi:hypothetical protein